MIPHEVVFFFPSKPKMLHKKHRQQLQETEEILKKDRSIEKDEVFALGACSVNTDLLKAIFKKVAV